MGRRVLVIDSSEAMRQHLRFILNGEGYDMEEVPDCRSALPRLDAGAGAYTVIIVDEEMDPEEYECLRRGRARASHRSDIPLLMLSSEEQLTEGAEEGTLRLLKPFSSSAILSMLHRLEYDAPECS